MEEIGSYIDYYNDERPHQATWNFAPSYIHEAKNKSFVFEELEAMKFETKAQRREYWNIKEMINMHTKLRDSLTGTISRDLTLT